MKRIRLIINPISGTLSKEGLDERVRQHLRPHGFDIETVQTEYAGHGAKLATEAVAKGYHAVIVAGGDGTVNEIAGALRGSDTALAILPFGSGNGLARHIYGSIDIDHALDIISLDTVTDCDYGTANGRPFFCTFGLGFDAKVSREFANMTHRGLISYMRSAVHEWIKFSPTEYEISTGEQSVKVKAFIVAVCNASQYGNNAYIAPRASINDGLLDITVIHDGNPLAQALAGVEMFTGRINNNILIQTFRVKEATIRHIPGPGHIDGEPCTMAETINIRCHPAQIKMFIDPTRPPLKPFVTLANSIKQDSHFLIKENIKILINRIANALHNSQAHGGEKDTAGKTMTEANCVNIKKKNGEMKK